MSATTIARVSTRKASARPIKEVKAQHHLSTRRAVVLLPVLLDRFGASRSLPGAPALQAARYLSATEPHSPPLALVQKYPVVSTGVSTKARSPSYHHTACWLRY
eukprot:2622853-Rhodomonas_salina.1